jgi:hypothetical protein
LFIAIGLLGCAGGSPPPPSPPPPKVTALDLRIADESASFLEQALSTLPDDHDIVHRYGRFISLQTDPVKMHSAYGGPFEGGTPACLKLRCRCTFEKFPAYLAVTIYEGKAGSGTAFAYQPDEILMEPSAKAVGAGRLFSLIGIDGEILMDPSPDAVATGVLSGCKPQLIGDQLWYVRAGGDQSRVSCTLDCTIWHPDFVP